jgi:hypothetical protein
MSANPKIQDISPSKVPPLPYPTAAPIFKRHWTTCSVCGRPTACTSIFCIHHTTVVAFQPKWWLTAFLMLAPTLTALLLSTWRHSIICYAALTFGIITYQMVAFRLLPATRDVVLLWSLAAFLLVSAYVLFPANDLVANIGVCGYFFVFGILIFLRALKYVRTKQQGIAVAIGAASSLVTVYSLSLECAWVLKYFGFARLWLSTAYSAWWFWIMAVRAALIFGSLVVLIVKAGTEISVAPGEPAAASVGLSDHVARQFTAWADFIFAFTKLFWELLVKSLHIVTRLAIRFFLEEVLPAFVVLAASAATLKLSVELSAYAFSRSSSTLWLGIAFLTIVLANFTFGYLKLAADADVGNLEWPPLRRAVVPYWYGAITDTRMLAAHISYVVPLTIVLLYCISQMASHFGFPFSSPGFGFYSFASTLSFLSFVGWGYIRKRSRRKTVFSAKPDTPRSR